MLRPKIETKDLLLSLTKNGEVLIKQTHRRPQKNIGIQTQQVKRNISFQSTNYN